MASESARSRGESSGDAVAMNDAVPNGSGGESALGRLVRGVIAGLVVGVLLSGLMYAWHNTGIEPGETPPESSMPLAPAKVMPAPPGYGGYSTQYYISGSSYRGEWSAFGNEIGVVPENEADQSQVPGILSGICVLEANRGKIIRLFSGQEGYRSRSLTPLAQVVIRNVERKQADDVFHLLRTFDSTERIRGLVAILDFLDVFLRLIPQDSELEYELRELSTGMLNPSPPASEAPVGVEAPPAPKLTRRGRQGPSPSVN